MRNQFLDYQKADNVIVVTLHPVKAAMDIVQLPGDLSDLCREIAFDDEIRVVVLTGSGETSFVIEPGTGEMPGEDEERETTSGSLAGPFARLDLPIIAAVHGDAISQGLELALACDMRITSEISHFGLPNIKAGLMPWDGGTQRLSRLVGRAKAIEMILTGEMIDAQEAFRIGLVNKVVPSEKLMATVLAMAQEMASKGPIALRYTKEAISKGIDMTLEQGLRLEADLYLLLHTTRDRTEGIKAFRNKRAPQFEGK